MKNFVLGVGVAFIIVGAVACSSDSSPTPQNDAGLDGSSGGPGSGDKGGATGGTSSSGGGSAGNSSGGSAGNTGGSAGNTGGSAGNSSGGSAGNTGGSAGNSSGGAAGSADSGADATADASAGTGTDASAEAGSSDGAMSDAGNWFDGTWQITNITCNGAEGNAQVQSFYTAPNTFTETFAGHSMQTVFTMKNGADTCALTCSYTFTLSGDRVSSTPSGPCTCEPANCLPGSCGTPPASGPYPGTVAHDGSGFTFTEPANTPDPVCTSAGQSNPIVFTGVPKN